MENKQTSQTVGKGPVGQQGYKVRQGDCISSIAFKYGFFPDTIWNDSKNSKLKQDRKKPNVLLPGDEVYIRDKEEKEESCASEKRHRFRRKGVPEKLRMRFLSGGEPRAREDYVLDIDGALSEGKTDKEGRVEIHIPPSARKGKLTFRAEGDEYKLQLGHLDPVSEISGVQGRLRNLGRYSGPIDGQMSEALAAAVRDFQKASNEDPTGKLDDVTRKKLEQAHGG